MTVHAPHRVVITGGESTGKTTLAQELAAHFAALWVPEQSRVYAERVQRGLTMEDVSAIGSQQIAAEDAVIAEATRQHHRFVFLDTDLISTVVYSRHYYGSCPAWIEAEAGARRADIYLLCAGDIPWVSDGIRDRPFHRDELDRAFREAVEEFHLESCTVRGLDDQRLAAALDCLESLGMKKGPTR